MQCGKGKEHMGRDDLAFVFSMKAADNGTLYGVCLHVPEIVQKPPTILGSSSPLCDPSMGGSRFLVAAPRCYCLLTRVPFFELHYEMLNRGQYKSFESPSRETEWMSSAIPVDSAMALTAAAAGLITEDEVPSASNIEETHSPSNASETSDFGPFKDLYQDGKRSLQDSDDFAPDVSESCANGVGRPYENYENGTCSPETTLSSHSDNLKLERSYSSISLYSSVRSMDEDDLFSNQDSDYSGDFMTMEWAKFLFTFILLCLNDPDFLYAYLQENKNDLLQIVCAYSSLPIPQRGSEVEFQPLEHLQAIQYKRCSVSELRIDESALDMKSSNPIKSAEINARLAAAEEAVALSVWTVATICRVLSLDNVCFYLTLLSGVLLEKQVIVVGSNLVRCSVSSSAFHHPYEFVHLNGKVYFCQLHLIIFCSTFSLFQILPAKLIDFLDAPVPIIVGIKTKPADFKIKTANLVLANVTKDQVKTCSMPLLPRRKELYSELRPIHAALAGHFRTAEKHPVYKYNEEQAEDATRFLNVMKRYMESLCADLRSYTITSVQSNNDRVSLLLKDSFVDSFSSRDRSFIKLFVDTQMFSVLSDSRLATFEHEKS
ncbi:DENN domain-containing protein 5B [Bienertia sinuspersici]